MHCGSHTGPAEPIDCGGARLCAARILADASGTAREGWLKSLLDALDSIKESEAVHYATAAHPPDYTLRPSSLRNRLVWLYNLVVELVQGVQPDAAVPHDASDADALPAPTPGDAVGLGLFGALPEAEEELRRAWRPEIMGPSADAPPDRNMSWEPVAPPSGDVDMTAG